MPFLNPIYNNATGTVYGIKSDFNDFDDIEKIQLQLGDIAILMHISEIKPFLDVIKSAKKGCSCENCSNNESYKVIKCKTAIAEIKFKANKKTIDDIEELVMAVLFHLDFKSIMDENLVKIVK